MRVFAALVACVLCMRPSVANAQERAPAAAGTQPRLAVQTLDYKRAKAAGATFLHNIDAPTVCTQIGQFDPLQNWEAQRDASVYFVATCGEAASATPEAFKNFRLQNGWRIRSVTVLHTAAEGGEHEVLTGPVVGSDNPYMRVRLKVFRALGSTGLLYRITIEGPAGTDPYARQP